MAKGQSLADSHKVSRACGRGYDEDKHVVTSAAFAPSTQEIRLHLLHRRSVDWVQCAYVSEADQDIHGSLKRLRVQRLKRDQYVAVLGVADIRSVKAESLNLDVVEAGNQTWECHCAIVETSSKPIDPLLQDELAKLANAHGTVVHLELRL